jgi:hypothetical protein
MSCEQWWSVLPGQDEIKVIKKITSIKELAKATKSGEVTPWLIANIRKDLEILREKHAREEHKNMYGTWNNITFDWWIWK